MRHPHLVAIDATTWPGVARVPGGRLVDLRARLAEATFARACANAGLDLDPEGDPDLVVEHEELFPRIAVSGWLGLAESFMAGEWRSDRLVDVLAALISTGYRPRTRTLPPSAYSGGELPTELVALGAGDGLSAFGGVFASGVPTTVRTAVPNHAPGRGPDTHFIDLQTFSEPVAVDREDLGDAQTRTVTMLLDAARVTAGTHLLEYATSGGAVAIQAAHRRATVDTLTADPGQAEAVGEQLLLAGVEPSVHLSVIDSPVPGPRDWRGSYDAIVSVEKLEVLEPADRVRYIKAFDRLLSIGGYAAMQSVIATDAMTPTARQALDVLRAYVWPGLDHPTAEDVHKLADRESGLRIIGQTHIGSHHELSLSLQRSLFEGHLREAAAAGFDIAFRRLWVYQFALREALFRLGMLDTVQFTMTHRNRRGRR
ncbi:cyclopropane-fatty-acyl-phospholipid synthase [Corynebacterium pollutisoli]|uniref:Cyclopropane-fatty-acyl-phospholipid synthase n=1 Tax=Corynebacterium pollutisoli TaxID=1610489 RepID=A0A1X7JQN6_9CORY|nr:class I SAM-dependent methyltransferase [Corynebacterium pollutisoli]SMG30019.1 cyclopropane-fatty-acyl-phospholipid synthase [Corynebacterium pollutisoli]